MKDGTFTADRLLALYDRVAEAEDAIPRLRRFVLDLAVRGKLVEQDPNDDPAAELLKRIAKEKARLINVGEIKETKPIVLNGEPVSPVPMGWLVVPLGEVINRHLGGGTPSKNDHSYWGGDIRWASVKDVGKAKYVDDTLDRITQKGLENSSSKLIPAGNLIVVTRMGLGQLSINRVPVAINQDLRALFLSPYIDIDFVYNFFLTYGMEGTGLTVKGIKIEELLGIPFPLPPLAEQQRIVAKVDELMTLCDRLQAARAGREAVRDRLTAASLGRLTVPETDAETFPTHARFALQTLPTLTTRPDQIKTLRQTILNLAVRGKLVEQDAADEPAAKLLKRIAEKRTQLVRDGKIKREKPLSRVGNEEMPFSLPVGWQWARLQETIDVRDGTHDSPRDCVDEDSVPLVTSKDFQNGDINFEGARRISLSDHEVIAKRSGVEVDDILFSMIGGNIGNQVMVKDRRPFSIKNVALFKYYDKRLTPPAFIKKYLENLAFFLQSQASGGAQPFVSLGFLRNLVIALPPLAEQHRIVAKVDALMAHCDQLEASLTTTTTTRSRLLEALLHEALDSQTEAAA